MVIKRIFCILIVTIFLICSLCIPSYAIDMESSFSDLLITDHIDYYDGSSTVPYDTQVTAAVHNMFSWDISTSNSIDTASLFIYSTSQPSSVFAYINNDPAFVTATFQGSYDSIYQYNFEIDSLISSIDLVIEYNVAGSILSLSVFNGYYQRDQIAPGFTVYGYMEYVDQSSADTDIVQRIEFLSSTYVNEYPWSKGHRATHSGLNSTGRTWNYDIYYIDLATRPLEFSRYQELTIQYISPNVSVIGDLAIYAAGTGKLVDTLPHSRLDTISYYPMADIVIDGNTIYNDNILYFNEVTFDISGIDLADCTLEFNPVLNPREGGRSGSDMVYFTYLSIESIFLTEFDGSRPWYQVFWNWLSGGLFDLGEMIVKAIEGTPEGTDPLEDPGNQLATQASEFNEAVDIIEGVTKPSIDIEQELQELPPPDPLVINTVQAMTGDQFLIKILIMAALMALVAIVLYGGKD